MGVIRDQILAGGALGRVVARPRRRRLGFVLLALAGLVLALLVAAVAGYQMTYQDRVYPGVSVAGHDLSGMREAEVQALLATLNPADGPVALRTDDGLHQWTLARADLGLNLDA